MITNFFIPELNNHDVQELWFQQDGATCHTARATIDLLKDTFGDRLVSRFGPVNWPPRSCDLTPLDYFLWGYVKVRLTIWKTTFAPCYCRYTVFLNVKEAPRTGRLVVEIVNKTTKIIKIDPYVSDRSIAQSLKIDHKTVLNHLRKVGFKKKLDVWVQHQLTPKNMMDRISICETLTKRNEIDPFLKRMVTVEKKFIPYDNTTK
ncbi:histone-lysine N-methyltransferase SETMAR [Trichonephila clavipes]|nr:histone-lysine N-methyltransferase SETMAR [Trichonephila clavipes]